MDDSLVHQVSASGQHLLHYLYWIFLGQFLFLLDVFVQIAMRAILHDDVEIICSFDNLVQPDHILMH